MILKIDAQALNWKEILSGNMASYKKNNVKKAVLKRNDGIIINQIEILHENEIFVQNNNGNVLLSYDSEDRLVRIVSRKIEYRISYFKNGMIESVEKEQRNNIPHGEGIYVIRNLRPDNKNPASIDYEDHFINTKDGSYTQVKKRFVFNQKDSLLNFNEDVYEKGYYRRYFNGAKVRKSINDHGFETDSVYTYGDKQYSYNFIRDKDRDIIVNKRDSVYTETYESGKIMHKKIEFSGTLYDEYFYGSGNFKKKKYIYYNANDDHYVLWEIRSTLKNGKIKTEYPAKKYYDFVGQKLIRNKKKFKKEVIKIGGCGGSPVYNKRYSFVAMHDIYSPSVVFSKAINFRIEDHLESTGFLKNEFEITYNKMTSEVPANGNGYFGTNLSLPQSFYKFLKEYSCREDYQVEITTNDDKTYSRKFREIADDFSIILNIFSTLE